MATPREIEPEIAWEDASEDLMEFDMEDEVLFDDFDEDTDDDEVTDFEYADDIPTWRLIEMAREDRFLKSELADFDDYDIFDTADNGFLSEYSH